MLRSDGLGCDGEGGHGDGDGAQNVALLLAQWVFWAKLLRSDYNKGFWPKAEVKLYFNPIRCGGLET